MVRLLEELMLIYPGDINTEIAVITGYQPSGIVGKIGNNISKINIGDRVVSRLNIGICGVCKFVQH